VGAFVRAAVAVPASAPQPYPPWVLQHLAASTPGAPAAHPRCALHYHYRLLPDWRSE